MVCYCPAQPQFQHQLGINNQPILLSKILGLFQQSSQTEDLNSRWDFFPVYCNAQIYNLTFNDNYSINSMVSIICKNKNYEDSVGQPPTIQVKSKLISQREREKLVKVATPFCCNNSGLSLLRCRTHFARTKINNEFHTPKNID